MEINKRPIEFEQRKKVEMSKPHILYHLKKIDRPKGNSQRSVDKVPDLIMICKMNIFIYTYIFTGITLSPDLDTKEI